MDSNESLDTLNVSGSSPRERDLGKKMELAFGIEMTVEYILYIIICYILYITYFIYYMSYITYHTFHISHTHTHTRFYCGKGVS